MVRTSKNGLYDCVRKSDERRYLDLFVHDGEKHSQ